MTNCMDRLQAYLAQNGVHGELEPHYTTYTALGLAAATHEKGKDVAKVFMALADGELVMFVLPAYARVDLGLAKDVLGCWALRAAREEEFSTVFPDCEVGAMPPFGNLYQVPVYLDGALARRAHLVFPVGTHQHALRLATSDYLRLVAPTLADFIVETDAVAAPKEPHRYQHLTRM